MGLFEWFSGKNTDDVAPVLPDRPRSPLPPRNTTIPGATAPSEPVAISIQSFGVAHAQLSHDLCEAATLVTDPADRLYVSSLIRVVKSGRSLLDADIPKDRSEAIALAADLFALPPDAEGGDRMRRHALATAAGAEVLAKGQPDLEADAFVAGLLHDVGRVVMMHIAEDGELVPRAGVLEGLIAHLHAGFSALVAERAGLSAQVVSALQFHHLPERSGPEAVILIPPDAERMTYTLAAADVVTHVVLAEPIEPMRVRALESILAHLEVGAIEEVVLAAEKAYRAMTS